jgi:hypothetical protein
MQNLTPVPILSGLNDVPEILDDGPNGAFVTKVVNELVQKSFRPFNTIDDNNQNYERYLDTVDGSDDNDGLTATTAYKTWDKAIEDFRVGMITDNWSTYLYVRGELQAPLDLRGVYGFSSSEYNNGTITLTKFPDDTENFTFKSVVETSEEYLSKLAFITDNTNINVYLTGVTFAVTSQLEFHGINTYIDNSIFKPIAPDVGQGGLSSRFIVYGSGIHHEADNTYDFTSINSSILITGVDCRYQNQGTITPINPPTSTYQFAFIEYGANVSWQAGMNSTVKATISVSSQGKLNMASWAINWLIQLQAYDVDFKWIDSGNRVKSLILTFPELTNGRYKIWLPMAKCRLYEYRLSANEGDATLMMDIGIGYPWGTPITQTFTSNYEEVVGALNIDFPANSWRMFLNVTDSTVPLKNVHLQLNYGDI